MKKLSTLTIIVTFVATLVGVGLIAISTYGLIEHQVKKHLQNEKAHALIVAKQAIVLPLWNYDEVYIQEVLNSLLDEQGDTVVAVKIISTNNLHHYQAISRNYKNKNLQELISKKEVDYLTDTVNYRGRDLGKIEVYYSAVQFATAFKNLGNVIFVITLCMGIAVASVVTFGLRRWLTYPLFEIATDAKKVGQGDYSVKFKTDYVGELNVVTEAFNETIKAIQARDQMFHEQNNRLEELVEKRTRERDLEQLKSFQASRLASLGEMAGAIAHEINNPLSIIKGYSAVLKTSLHKANNPELAENAEKIYSTSERIAKIVKGLKVFSRDGTNDPASLGKIELFVEDLTGLCMNRASQKEIPLKFHYNLDEEIYSNMTHLGQVLINLINNSIDAVEFLDEKWIEVKFETHSSFSRITITDSGRGIDENIQDKIMIPFFTTKEMGKGTGLGLSVSHGIISRNGGDIYYNRDAENTQFVILLPRKQTEHASV